MEKIQRQSNFELLRIIAMFLIVLHHFCVHGIFPLWNIVNVGGNSFNTYACEFLSIGGKIAVDIFIFITGYFMVNTDFRLEKFFNLYLKTIFYSVLIMFFFAYFGQYKMPSFLNYALLPMNSVNYWFISKYLFLYMLTPFINIFIRHSGKKMHLSLIVLLFFFWSMLFTLTGLNFSFSELGWFVFLYITGAYIRLYPNKLYDNNKLNLLSLFAMCILSILILLGLNHSHFVPMFEATKYMSDSSFIIVIISLNIFFLFKNLKIQNSLINSAAQSVLGVYLIHDNVLVGPFLWVGLLNVIKYMKSEYFIPMAILTSFTVFVVCILLDKVFNSVFSIIFKFIKAEKLSCFNKFINHGRETSTT